MIRPIRALFPFSLVALLLSELAILSATFLGAAYLLLEFDPAVYLLYERGLLRVAMAIVLVEIGLYFNDLYVQVRVTSRLLLAQQLCMAMGVAIMLQGVTSYFDSSLRLPIRVMLAGSLGGGAAIYLWRIFFSAFALKALGGERLLFLGSSPLLDDIARRIDEHPELGATILGFLNEGRPGLPETKLKDLGPLDVFPEVVRAAHPDRIVVALAERRQRLPLDELMEFRLRGGIVEELGTTYERTWGRVPIQELRPSRLIYAGMLGPRRRYLAYQRLWNLALALAGLILAAPVMLLTAALVRLSSRGPVFYRQARVGINSSHFTLYKFRSMREDAESATGAVWAAKDDPRVTPVGRWLRKLRIDELPQLINVLKGDMLMVGPRPERPEFVRQLTAQIPYYRQRSYVRPGITGWAQINHKYGDTLEDAVRKLEYDLYYVKNMSWSLDMYIVLVTAKTMLLSRGAQ